jgi:ABC-2 type transport system ATP-binding protein
MDGICDAIGIIKNGRMVIERDLDDLKSDVHKIQVAFPAEYNARDFSGLTVLRRETRGSIELLVVRGKGEEVSTKIKAMQPLLYDNLPLTLEEIFIYETEGAPHEAANIPY